MSRARRHSWRRQRMPGTRCLARPPDVNCSIAIRAPSWRLFRSNVLQASTGRFARKSVSGMEGAKQLRHPPLAFPIWTHRIMILDIYTVSHPRAALDLLERDSCPPSPRLPRRPHRLHSGWTSGVRTIFNPSMHPPPPAGGRNWTLSCRAAGGHAAASWMFWAPSPQRLNSACSATR